MSAHVLQSMFEQQKVLLDHFFEHLDFAQVKLFADVVVRCKGLLFLTGTGKSGIIGRTISQMFVSVGVRAVYINPVDALHGDVGVMTADDVLVMFSKSGQTAELINLVPAARNKKVFVVAVVSNPQGQLAALSDVAIHLPLQKELCPFGMAPTTSTIVQLIFGNTVVATLMSEMKLTREAYAMNHPAGRIGKRLTVKVDDVMRTDLALCRADETLIDKIDVMSAKRCGCLLITDDAKTLLGIFTDGDLRRAIQHGGAAALSQTVGQFMKRNPATCMVGAMAYDAMMEMERDEQAAQKKRVKELPVVDSDGCVRGLVTLHDLVNFGL